MHPNPTHLSSPPYHTCQRKQNIETNMKTSLHKSTCVSQCVLQHTHESTQLYLQMFLTVNHWSGLRPLASAALSILAPPWDSSQGVVALCHEDAVALVLQDLPLHMLQQMTWMLARVGQLKALDGS